jgi:hypothetical protein
LISRNTGTEMDRWMLILFVAFILIFQSFWTGDGDVGFYVWFA